MADVEPPSVLEDFQASADTARLLPSPAPCSEPQLMEQPPPYMQAPPLYSAYPSFNPQNPPNEPYHPQELGYQCSSEGQPVVEGCGLVEVSGFENKSIRLAFIRKVFSLVTLQLLFTFSVVCVFTFSRTVKEYMMTQNGFWIMISSYITFVVMSLVLICCRSFSRLHPWNLVALGLVTLSLSYVVGAVASCYNTHSVVIAMGSTLAVSFSIIIFSAQTKVDFTICNGILVTLSTSLLMFGFFSIFYYSTIVDVVYGFLGALLFSLFLVVDCQLVMGRQTYALSPEEYVFGALIVYLDIINVFLYILLLFGGGSRS
ncbi:protein lifeguard 1 [Sardina pilchardus]|uniref:protein lifeguard 1 n=1 Tax=Sardina pilchardus TaxID=27697 RepID=UPI002E120B4D